MKGTLPLRVLLVLILLGALLPGSPAHAGGIAPDLARKIASDPNSTEQTRLIVRFRDNSISGLLFSLLYGGQLLGDLPLVGGLIVSLPINRILQMAQDPAVEWVSPDRTLRRQWDYDTQSVGADQVWAAARLTGTGVRVAVLDTGVTSNTSDWNRWGSSTSRVVGWKDLVAGRFTPYDDHGHGTHVAGVLLGSGNRSGGRITGTAPDADLVAVKVLGPDGTGSASTVIKGITWCIQNRSRYGIRVLNLSLGHVPGESSQTDPLCRAIRRAVQAGLVVVCSAGNRGKDASGRTVYGGISSPGVEPAAITVGALNTFGTASREDDGVTGFSSRGPSYPDHHVKPDLVAPGNWIISVRSPGSSLDRRYPEWRVDPDPENPDTVPYFQLSGSSMAAPQVAGTVAMMLQANPTLAPNTVKGALMFTAERLALRDASGQPLEPGLSLLTQGGGSLNALGAVTLASRINGAAAVGQPWLTRPVETRSSFGGQWVEWSAAVTWGGSVYLGSAVFATRQAAWSSGVTWGDQATWGEAVFIQEDGVTASQPAWEQDWTSSPEGGEGGSGGDQATWGEGPPNAYSGNLPPPSDPQPEPTPDSPPSEPAPEPTEPAPSEPTLSEPAPIEPEP